MTKLPKSWREHLSRIGKSKSPRKLAALADAREKRAAKHIPSQTPGAIYQRARRAKLKETHD